MGLDFHRSLFQIIFHLLVSERTYSDCENQLYFDVIERFLWIVYYVLSILAIAIILLCYGRCLRAFGMIKSKAEVVFRVDSCDSTIQTSEGWAVVYHQNDELRTRTNIQHRRLKKAISEISNKRVQPKKPGIKPIAKVSRWRRKKVNSKPSDGCIKMLLETKQQLLDRLAALAELYSEALQQKKDLKCALSTSENQLFQNNRDAQLNWIQWQAAQRTIAETTTKALKMKGRLEEKKDYDPVASSDDLSACSSLVHVDPAPDSARKRHGSSGSGTSSLRHRNPTGDAAVGLDKDETPCIDDDIVGSIVTQSDSAADKPTSVRGQIASSVSPDRLAASRQHQARGSDSPERRGRCAGRYLRRPAPSKSPERSSSGSACERLRFSFSPDRRVGVVCGMPKSVVRHVDTASERHIATAAVFPERRSSDSPERKTAEALTKSQEYRRIAVSQDNPRTQGSPERRRVAVVPECPRLHTSVDRRRLTSTERHRVQALVVRRHNYPFAGEQQRPVSHEQPVNRAQHW